MGTQTCTFHVLHINNSYPSLIGVIIHSDDVRARIPRTCEYVPSHVGKMAVCRCDSIKGFVTGRLSCCKLAQHNDKASYKKEGGEIESEGKDSRPEAEVHRCPCLTSASKGGGRGLGDSKNTDR